MFRPISLLCIDRAELKRLEVRFTCEYDSFISFFIIKMQKYNEITFRSIFVQIDESQFEECMAIDRLTKSNHFTYI